MFVFGLIMVKVEHFIGGKVKMLFKGKANHLNNWLQMLIMLQCLQQF